MSLRDIEELLFERSSRGMMPTTLGGIVLAQAMLHDLDHLTRDIEALVAGHPARLHIGVIPFISSRALAAAIRNTLSQMTQRLTITIHEGTSEAYRRANRFASTVQTLPTPIRLTPASGYITSTLA
ncbi:hypothetical protein [Paraburkholderia metrosideri]